jgi:hypothetical protein
MKNLRDQLKGLGIVPVAQIREIEAEDELTREASERQSQKETATATTVDDLDNCETMDTFKQAAKQVLLADPRRIAEVIKKAHRFKNLDDEAARKFIRFFYELRSHLSAVPLSKQPLLLNRAFRRRNPKFSVE